MLRDEAVELIAFRLGNRSDLRETIIREMQHWQRELENRPSLPWFLLSEISSIETEVGEERLPLPVDFLREPEEETALWHYTVDNPEAPWKELSKQAFDRSRVKYVGSGKPEVYSLSAGYFRLMPIPDAVYTIKMIYYKRALPLTSNFENEWLKDAPGVLVGTVGMTLAGVIDNAGALGIFTEEFKSANNNLMIQNTARQEANRTRHMGERP